MRHFVVLIFLVITGFFAFYFSSNPIDELGPVPNQTDTAESSKKELAGAESASNGNNKEQIAIGAPAAAVKKPVPVNNPSQLGTQNSTETILGLPAKMFGTKPKKLLGYGGNDAPKSMGPTMRTNIGGDGTIWIKSASLSHHPSSWACDKMGINSESQQAELMKLWQKTMNVVSGQRVSLSKRAIELYNQGLPIENVGKDKAFIKAKTAHDEVMDDLWKAYMNAATDFSKEGEARRLIVDSFGQKDFWGAAFRK